MQRYADISCASDRNDIIAAAPDPELPLEERLPAGCGPLIEVCPSFFGGQ